MWYVVLVLSFVSEAHAHTCTCLRMKLDWWLIGMRAYVITDSVWGKTSFLKIWSYWRCAHMYGWKDASFLSHRTMLSVIWDLFFLLFLMPAIGLPLLLLDLFSNPCFFYFFSLSFFLFCSSPPSSLIWSLFFILSHILHN